MVELWEREPNTLPSSKGGDAYRKKRMTKGRLVRNFNRKENDMSPKIDTEVREGADDITEGIPYQITNVEEITTDVQNLEGIRVTVSSTKGEEGNVVLWKRKITGSGSKLGVFITLLGNNTDKWLNQWIQFVEWKPRQRQLLLLEAPKGKKPKAK